MGIVALARCTGPPSQQQLLEPNTEPAGLGQRAFVVNAADKLGDFIIKCALIQMTISLICHLNLENHSSDFSGFTHPWVHVLHDNVILRCVNLISNRALPINRTCKK